MFDHPVKKKHKRKAGDVKAPDKPARGAQPIRSHHRRDETKIFPHVRRGIQL